ncbi:MAG: PCRF domain-containing protein, partial [Dehalococcoidia bacterium]
MEGIIERLEWLEKRYEEINGLMAKDDIISDPEQLQKLAQEQSSIRDTVLRYRQYKDVTRSLTGGPPLPSPTGARRRPPLQSGPRAPEPTPSPPS